jgi:hypothetical protein
MLKVVVFISKDCQTREEAQAFITEEEENHDGEVGVTITSQAIDNLED